MDKIRENPSDKRSHDDAFGWSEASHGKRTKTDGESGLSMGERTLRRFFPDGERIYISPYPLMPCGISFQLVVRASELRKENSALRSALAEERKKAAYWRKKFDEIRQSVEERKDQATLARQLEKSPSPPLPQSESPVKPAAAAGSAVIDLTGDDIPPTGQTPVPSPDETPAQKGAQLRESIRAKSYSWLGERNHMKKGYVAPPIWESNVRRAKEIKRTRRTRRSAAASAQAASRADSVGQKQKTKPFDKFADEFEKTLQADASRATSS
jgi:hypothetical protein